MAAYYRFCTLTPKQVHILYLSKCTSFSLLPTDNSLCVEWQLSPWSSRDPRVLGSCRLYHPKFHPIRPVTPDPPTKDYIRYKWLSSPHICTLFCDVILESTLQIAPVPVPFLPNLAGPELYSLFGCHFLTSIPYSSSILWLIVLCPFLLTIKIVNTPCLGASVIPRS